MAYPDSVPPGVTTETPGSGAYRILAAELERGFAGRAAAAMEHPRSDETREKQIVGLYCNIYDEKNTVWRTLFPGMTPEWIIENMIPGYIEGVNFFKFPNLNIDLENIPMVISDYVALGWIDPTLVSDNEADMPYQRYINAVTPLGMNVINRSVSINTGAISDSDKPDARMIVA